MRLPVRVQRPLKDCSSAFRGIALSLAKAFSIGLKSGFYGGRIWSVAPADPTRFSRALIPVCGSIGGP